MAVPVAWDALGQAGLTGRWYGIDRAGPVITELRGNMLNSEGSKLTVSASDGTPYGQDSADPLSWGNAGSGVKRIELRIDGQVVNPTTDVASQSCDGDGISGNGDPAAEVPWASCGMSRTFDVDAAAMPGPHTIDVLVTDMVGNITSQSATATFGPEPATTAPNSVVTQTITLNGPTDTAQIDLDVANGQEIVTNADGSVEVVEPDPDSGRSAALESSDQGAIASTNNDPSVPAPPPFQTRPATSAEMAQMRDAAVSQLKPDLSQSQRTAAVAEIDAAISALGNGQPATTNTATTSESDIVQTVANVGVDPSNVAVGIDYTTTSGSDVITAAPDVAPASSGSGVIQDRAGGKKVNFPIHVKVSVVPKNKVVKPTAPSPPSHTVFKRPYLPPSPTTARAFICHRDNNQNIVESPLGSDLFKVGENIHWCQTGSPWPVANVQVKSVDRKATILPSGATVGWSFINWLNKHEGWQSGDTSNPHFAYFVKNRGLFKSPLCTPVACETSTPWVWIRVAADGKVRWDDGGG